MTNVLDAAKLTPADIAHLAKVHSNDAELSDEVYHKLFNYYLSTGEMPYGTAKARTGDPYEFVLDKVSTILFGGDRANFDDRR